MPNYFQLVCETCKEAFEPLVATEPGELLDPDYDEALEHSGSLNVGGLRDFHQRHLGHALKEVELAHA